MYDSVTPSNIPANAMMIGGYVDGLYVWPAEGWARFSNAVKVRIAVSASTNDGHVLDVEKGDATPDQAPVWVQQRRSMGADPSVYCNLSTWPAVRQAFVQAGVPEPHYWIAAYGQSETIPAGAVAFQYRDAGPYDLSVVDDYWPGVDPLRNNEQDAFTAALNALSALWGVLAPVNRQQADLIHGAAVLVRKAQAGG